MSPPSTSSSIQHATYPLPQPLALLLEAVLQEDGEGEGGVAAGSANADKDTTEGALTQLIGNAFSAMDRLYFNTKPHIRGADWFAHRMCLRITITSDTLSITDLGAGMTRADLINSLGVGRLSKKAMRVATTTLLAAATKQRRNGAPQNDGRNGGETADPLRDEPAQGELNDDGENDPPEEDETIDTEDDEDDEELEDDETSKKDNDDCILPCMEADIGGFYSALCALGRGVTIGTKSTFDDYYEFSYGKTPQTPNGCYTHFTISRPMDEGTIPTVDNGYSGFSDVRGESGTRVTIYGTFDENVIRPLVAKIMATSQYTVAFAGDQDEASIIAASKLEHEARTQLESAEPNVAVDDETADLLETDSPPMIKATVKERAKYIPLRLTLGERKMLRLVEAAMACCEYTSNVDTPDISTARRTHAQLQGIASILRGLVTACDYTAGQRVSTDQDELDNYQAFFQKTFEIARRHKIMNPEKMRTEYGKLIYFLQDAVSPTVQPHLGFSIVGPIVTVYDFLKERGGIKVLEDKFIDVATEEVDGRKKTRQQIRTEIHRKEKAVALIKAKYKTSRLTEDDIHLALYSIGDNNSFLHSDRVPIDMIIEFLKKYFSPNKVEEGYALTIASGENGARLSHSHERQYYFALQSLTLWRDIIDDMFRLWQMAEDDLLSETVTYSLQDTGQGLQRVQQSPRTYRAMQQVLHNVQHNKVHQWIGSSVIHMGDHNVPNALSFIDKYTQVPRILGPIVACLENLAKLYEESSDITQLVDTSFGGLEKLRKDILHDFFRSAFDGSGADNFYDAGSCIDGRLTSAWNWCSQLPTKPYYCIFKLTGFVGFDGDFK